MKRPEHQRIHVEDALKHLWECGEAGRTATVESVAGALGVRRGKAAGLLSLLRARALAEPAGDAFRLTADGRQYALQVVRTHRLYETWLSRETGLPAADWHRVAHQAEHHLGREAVDRMADTLNNPRFDPHGDPIPTREGVLPPQQRVTLAEWPDGQDAAIEHLEDEPESLFRRFGRLGIGAGLLLENPRHCPDGAVAARAEGRDLVIPAVLVPMVHVAAPDPDQAARAGLGRLVDLRPGQRTTVRGLSPTCLGNERRRLLDLGLVPGTPVACAFTSPFGSPRSYEIRSSLIALRDDQAARILVDPSPNDQ